jgi:energy-coupling factor transporter ATP-binding protein EcfA2
MHRGFLITFEGLDGSGKTTQLRKLAALLESRGERLTVTRQPGGTRLGDRIRSLLLDSKGEAIAARAEMALMFADRAQAIAEIIEPALARASPTPLKPTRAEAANWEQRRFWHCTRRSVEACSLISRYCCFLTLTPHSGGHVDATSAACGSREQTRAALSAKTKLFTNEYSCSIERSLHVSLCVSLQSMVMLRLSRFMPLSYKQ